MKFPINIDARALTQRGLVVYSLTDIFDTRQVQQVEATPGVYLFLAYSALFADVGFTVTSDGTVDYDPSLDGVLSGRGTSTLRVNGCHVTLDATALSQAGLQLLLFDFPLLDTRAPVDMVLLPAHDGYTFLIGSAMLSNFGFDVDVAGRVHIVPDYRGIASGDGTPTLRIQGARVFITAEPTIDSMFLTNLLGGPVVLQTTRTNEVHLLPALPGTGYPLTIVSSKPSTPPPLGFNLDLSGNFIVDSTLDGYLHGSGTPSLYVYPVDTPRRLGLIMRLKEITATPHPKGNRIDLHWINPDPQNYPGIRVVRREGTYPTSPQEGALVTEGTDLPYSLNEHGERQYNVEDKNLQGGTIYYYTLFPYQGDPTNYVFDRHNRTSAMATSPYDMAGQMYDLVPGIYHRYDTVLPRADAPASDEDKQKGQLRRFLDLPGSQLDQIYSLARAMLELYDLNKTDGRWLPLLAQWIGWQTDYRLEFDTQRNEIRNAPYLYKTIGIIPTVEATVKRIFGWESRTKEFVHNVFLSNCPERLNLWLSERDQSGRWSKPSEPFSLDFAYEGRPAAVRDRNGALWLFYHTLRKGRWEIWYKTFATLFNLALAVASDLDAGIVSLALIQAFTDARLPLSQQAAITMREAGKEWQIADRENRRAYLIRNEGSQLTVYGWTPSQPFTDGQYFERHPTAALQGNTFWVFWDRYDEAGQTWQIHYRKRSGESWDPVQPFADDAIERKRPWAVVDDQGGLWLFWLEKTGSEWQLKYKLHNGQKWLDPARAFPLDGDPRVESDHFVLFHPTTHSLWVFWSRKKPIDSNQTPWQIAFRVKQSLDPAASDWSVVQTLPIDDGKPVYATADDREPAAIVAADGDIELFWSSTRNGSWSIWRARLNVTTHAWDSFDLLPGTFYSQRDPLPIASNTGLLLFHRSNESLNYASTVYSATETLDARYAGCTTVDACNRAKSGLRGLYADFQAYTYDAGQDGQRTDRNWYARDTVGMYLTPSSEDFTLITRNRNLIERVLRQFLPIQVRLVFIIQLADRELIYTYDYPQVKPPRLIGEQVFDSLITETYSGLVDGYRDKMLEWIWIRSWSKEYPNHRTIDFTATPINTRFRIWHTGLEAGG